MGCLRLTYRNKTSPLQISRDEKTVPKNWQVWVSGKGEKQHKGVRGDQNGGGQNNPNSDLSLIGVVSLGKTVYELNNPNAHLHYLPKSNSFKVYNRAYVNRYTNPTNIGMKGNAIIFFINQANISFQFSEGNIDKLEFSFQTWMNIGGTINPVLGSAMVVGQLYDAYSNWWNNSPTINNFFNDLTSSFNTWVDTQE